MSYFRKICAIKDNYGLTPFFLHTTHIPPHVTFIIFYFSWHLSFLFKPLSQVSACNSLSHNSLSLSPRPSCHPSLPGRRQTLPLSLPLSSLAIPLTH